MASDVCEGLKVPTRPAPPPPKLDTGANGHGNKRSTSAASNTVAMCSSGGNGLPIKSQSEKRSDKYVYQSVPRSRSTSDIFGNVAGGKKKPPPPRPPPPKVPPITNVTSFNSQLQQKPQSIKIKLPGFKSRRKHHSSKPHVHVSTWRATPNKSHPLVGSLIDLKSPAQSPGFNNRSSSDESSVDSFDSDSGGDPSSNECRNGWNSSQVESGFEDDFDRLSTPSSCVDPWSTTTDNNRSTAIIADPFSPLRRSAPLPMTTTTTTTTTTTNNQFDISNEDPKTAKKFVNFPSTNFLSSSSSSAACNFRPTVIRPTIPSKNRKPPSSLSLPPPPPPTTTTTTTTTTTFYHDNDFVHGSPPMPSIPPPPPPPEAFDLLANGPPIPARPSKIFKIADQSLIPRCVALYDYTGDHAEDLSFQENDVIILKRYVNDEWLQGELNGKIGIFPACFVKILVPPTKPKQKRQKQADKDGEHEQGELKEEKEAEEEEDDDEDYDYDYENGAAVIDTEMIALFNYHAETWDDLELKEGDLIRVIGKVDENWLYGKCNGKQGQFPVSYVAEYLLD